MPSALKLCFAILLCGAFVEADVSHLGYTRFRGQRLRLQRLEAEPTPYPASGYRPNREFGLPREQPLFPLGKQHSNRPHVSSGFDNLGEPQRPQLTYGSPQQEPRYRPQSRPQKFNRDEPQPQVFVVQYESADGNQQRQPSHNSNNFDRPQQPQGSSHFNNGYNNFAETQQTELEVQSQYPSQHSQNSNNDFNDGFNNLAEPQQSEQRPDVLNGAPNNQEQEAQSARLRQQLIARLQQAQRLEKLQQQTVSQAYRQSQSQSQQQQLLNAPQTLYSAPSQQLQQTQLQSQSQAYRQTQSQSQQHQLLKAPQTLYSAPSQQLQSESQASRLIAQKPARLTDNREETEIESDIKASETVEDIETTTKAESKKTFTQTANPSVVANTGLVNYYPASAVGFVQPLNAAYLTAANFQTFQPVSAAYTVGSPYLPQQYTLAGAPAAQLQAW